jgi:hypothetical protein
MVDKGMHPITYEALTSAGLAVAGIFALMACPDSTQASSLNRADARV